MSRGSRIVLGVVALPTSSSGPALQTSRTGQAPLSHAYLRRLACSCERELTSRSLCPRIGMPIGHRWGSGRVAVQDGGGGPLPTCGMSVKWIALPAATGSSTCVCRSQVKNAQKIWTVHIGLGRAMPGTAPATSTNPELARTIALTSAVRARSRPAGDPRLRRACSLFDGARQASSYAACARWLPNATPSGSRNQRARSAWVRLPAPIGRVSDAVQT